MDRFYILLGEKVINRRCVWSKVVVKNAAACIKTKGDPMTIVDEQRKLLTGLEKIEPLEGGLTVIDKLNETIDKVNRIIDYLNQGVKK